MKQSVPAHLKKYVVEQNYSRYTAEDQAVWRFILRQLKTFLTQHAHSAYVDGLQKTGIEIDHIPDISVMDRKLTEFGWRAMPVSGFIPPAAFMEFQSLGILPIASDMRTLEHLAYTPAPDIVHEAAGHAPMLILREYADYLKSYADVARNAILTAEDLDQYEAIRILSDTKENPDSTPEDVKRAEDRLNAVNSKIPAASEAGWLSRMNWWTAEYGLVGPLQNPKIFGAGLLSSVGESRHCLNPSVKKIPLSLDCIETGYDITEPQPQLFVAENFHHLHDVLESLAEKMAFRLGGDVGLKRARDARTVNTIQLNSGLQISGTLSQFTMNGGWVEFIKLSGPVALAVDRRQLNEHGTQSHAQGFSSPLGTIGGLKLSSATDSDLARLGIAAGRSVELKFDSGIALSGEVVNWTRHQGTLILIQFKNCRVSKGQELLYRPDWGPFDLAIGESVVSVFGGAADRSAYGDSSDFVAARVPPRKVSPEQRRVFDYFSRLRQFRTHRGDNPNQTWRELATQYERNFSGNWLMVVELIELVKKFDLDCERESQQIIAGLNGGAALSPAAKECLEDGLRVAGLDI